MILRFLVLFLLPGLAWAKTGLTLQRIESLPASQRHVWLEYWEKSRAARAHDQATLQRELSVRKLRQPENPPKGGLFQPPSDARQALEVARNVVSFQSPSGGWSKNISFQKGPRRPGMHWARIDGANPWHFVGTFDNGATTTQLAFLARLIAQGHKEFRPTFNRGLDYILDAQYPNGGWPQVWPLEGDYHDAITINDNATYNILSLLRDVASGKGDYAFVDKARRARAKKAFDNGLRLLLRLQAVRDGRYTIWFGQYDPLTLKPIPARRQEPVALVTLESAWLVRLLMSIPNPPRRIIQAIEDALAWFEQTRIIGIRHSTRDGNTYYELSPTHYGAWWARFYDANTNQPIFAGAQNGKIYRSFEEMWKNGNRANYIFYTPTPEELLKHDRKVWERRLRN